MSTSLPPASGDSYALMDDPTPILPGPSAVPAAPTSSIPSSSRQTNPAADPGEGLNLVIDPEPIGPTVAVSHAATTVDAQTAAEAKRREAEAKKAQAEAEKQARAEAKARAKAEKAAARARKRSQRTMPVIPGWVGSMAVHAGVLVILLLLPGAAEEAIDLSKRLNAAVDTSVASVEEPLKIMADPSQIRSEYLTDPNANPVGGVLNPSPSATPVVAAAATVSSKSAMPQAVELSASIASPLASMPSMPAVDFAGGGGIAGDVTQAVDNVDQALDQLVREILRELQRTKLTVVWMFDESNSMKDDQQAIRDRFERISSELIDNTSSEQRRSAALLHAVVGFGQQIHFDLEPTPDVTRIKEAITNLRIDMTGTENTMQSVQAVIARLGSKYITKERRMLIVLVTDESGDDGARVEETIQACLAAKVSVYVIGRQSLFGTDKLHIAYTDPVTKDVYYPTIQRGPETADFEMLQFDGLHGRWDEVPSGFAPYELARLTKETGGAYFILPNEEELRRRNRRLERIYSITTLKEYVPDYESRAEYLAKREKSELRRVMAAFINQSKQFPFRHHFPVDPQRFVSEIQAVQRQTAVRLTQLAEMEKALRALEKLRDREPEKRWQAAYDLMLAQTVAYQVKVFEYQNLLAHLLQTKPVPKVKPSRERTPDWEVFHSPKKYANPDATAKKYAEAEELLKRVIERHPNTPWADFAKHELDRGLSVDYHERVLDARYSERARLVPKY
jgi:tetratricopeptide (TPR) repeat protein